MSIIEPEDFRLQKLQELKRLGVAPYGVRFSDTTPIVEILEGFDPDAKHRVRAAGRITHLRAMGKASFMNIKDRTGSIQVFFQLDQLGEERFHLHQQLDTGDIIGVDGDLGATRTGEVTIFVDEFVVLAKALLSPPEKWHGLRDPDKRFRQRYVDLFANDAVMQCFLKRIHIIRSIRAFLAGKGFLEVETPMMQPIPGGAAARPFVTHHNALDMDLYLRIAPELYLKRLLVGGMEKVFEINRNFRNEGISVRHNPEFTMLELYQAYADYEVMMELTEELLAHVALEVCGSLVVTYGDVELDLTPPWPRKSFWSLLEEHASVRRSEEASIRAKAAELEVEGAQEAHPDWLALQVFQKCVEDTLRGPVFVKDYPTRICPLTKASPSDPQLAERFELYMAGMECANAYTELSDPLEQEKRFLEQVGREEERERIDRDFLQALAYGMPPAGGLGIGVDRLVMVLTDNANIREVILFPLLRPQG